MVLRNQCRNGRRRGAPLRCATATPTLRSIPFLRRQRLCRCKDLHFLPPSPVAAIRYAPLRGPHGRHAFPQDKRLNAASISWCSHGSRRYTPHCPIGSALRSGRFCETSLHFVTPYRSALSCSSGIHITTPRSKGLLPMAPLMFLPHEHCSAGVLSMSPTPFHATSVGTHGEGSGNLATTATIPPPSSKPSSARHHTPKGQRGKPAHSITTIACTLAMEVLKSPVLSPRDASEQIPVSA